MSQFDAMDRFTTNAEILRNERNLSIQALADAIGMKREQLSKILAGENGKNGPTLKVMERIAAGLGVDVRELLDDVAVAA